MIIGLIGKMGVGKSTAANFLLDHIPESKLVKFAQPLYDLQDLIYNRLNLTLEGAKDRKLLQLLGTDWGRNTISDTIWLDQWVSEVNKQNVPIICDDCRFENEASVVKEMGGIIIKIEGEQRGDEMVSKGHASEKDVDTIKADYIITNTGSISELYDALRHIVSQQRGG